MILSRGIADKEPIDQSHSFSAADQTVYAFASFRNPGAPTRVTFAWYREGALTDTVTLTIGQAVSWRTWSKSRIQPGTWRVAITDAAGTVLGESSFVVD